MTSAVCLSDIGRLSCGMYKILSTFGSALWRANASGIIVNITQKTASRTSIGFFKKVAPFITTIPLILSDRINGYDCSLLCSFLRYELFQCIFHIIWNIELRLKLNTAILWRSLIDFYHIKQAVSLELRLAKIRLRQHLAVIDTDAVMLNLHRQVF